MVAGVHPASGHRGPIPFPITEAAARGGRRGEGAAGPRLPTVALTLDLEHFHVLVWGGLGREPQAMTRVVGASLVRRLRPTPEV